MLEDETADVESRHALWMEFYGRLRQCLLPWIQKRASHSVLTLNVEDAFQETMVRWFAGAVRLHQFKYVDELSTLKWFYATARNVLLEEQRRAASTVSLDHGQVDSRPTGCAPGPEIPLLDSVRFLTSEERAIVERRVLGGYSLREISQQTGWGLSRCKRISSSALSKLREALTAPDPGGGKAQ